MANGVHYNNLIFSSSSPREERVPQCNRCHGGSDAVELIDFVSNASDIGGGAPVWYCGSCKKIFSGRTTPVLSDLDSNFIKSGTSPSPGALSVNLDSYTQGGVVLRQAIKDEALIGLRDKYGASLEMIPELYNLRSADLKLEKKLDRLLKFEEERRSDPLSDLRERVAKFKLA